jgi:hypothetical protein
VLKHGALDRALGERRAVEGKAAMMGAHEGFKYSFM